MITFENEDSHYEQFVSANEGFVLIESPFLGKGQWMLHRSHCYHLGREKAENRLTERARRWASSSDEFSVWMKRQGFGEWQRCLHCRTQGE